ncbi:MAG: hypothetical protein ICV69_12105 [Thermoleophilaceae bacterium]|nr:hypothetical protein [Thermoleophilaceae bacterium]
MSQHKEHQATAPASKSRAGVAGTRLGLALAMCVVLLAACGDDNGSEPTAKSSTAKLASARAIEGDPYAIACGHVRNQQQWADVTRRATVTLADRERIPGLNRLQATQSLFFAMTELCKERPASYQPAKPAVEAVRAGTYRADLGAP